jgi:radical SAM protein with 4Fe4S-binding SPASM domain
LTFFVTKRCNAHCPYCFYLSSQNGHGKGEGELTLDEIGNVSASMGDLLWLAFSGGEIFMRNDIDKIAEIFYRQNRPSIILLPTNGLLPDISAGKTEEILKSCRNSTVVVKLSIDGTGEDNDALRGVKGSLEKTIRTYELMERLQGRYENMELGVNTVFTSANQDRMDDIIEFVRGMKGIRTHTVSLIRGDVGEEILKDIDIEKYRYTARKLEEEYRKRNRGMYRFAGARLKTAQDIVQRRIIYKTCKENKKQLECYAGRLTLVLTENGDVFPCESFSPKLGNVRENGYDMMELLANEKNRKTVGAIRDGGCFCTHECYAMMNILFNPAMYPSLLKEYVRF